MINVKIPSSYFMSISEALWSLTAQLGQAA